MVSVGWFGVALGLGDGLGNAATAASTKARCDDIGAANCALRNASYPWLWTCAISASVAPKVACERKRPAAATVGVPPGNAGGGEGVGTLCAPVDKLKNPFISPVGYCAV